VTRWSGERDKCLKTRLEERQFRVFYATRGRTGPLRGRGKPVALKTGIEPRICKTSGVGANPIQD